MFAVRDKRTGKFARPRSRSGRFAFTQSLGREPTKQEWHDYIYSLPSPEGAELWKSKAGVKNSYCSQREIIGYKKCIMYGITEFYKPIYSTIEEALPWLEIVEVTINYMK